MNRPTPAQFLAYQQLFDYFNTTLFEGCLPDCMLNFGKHRGSQAFLAERWRQRTGTVTPEISLDLAQLSRDEPIEAMAALVRAMVHLWQESYGSTSRRWYYNREWADKMEEVGLIPTDTGEPGGKRTGQGIKHYIEPNGPFLRAFNKMPETPLWPFLPTAPDDRPGRPKLMRYHCPCCGTRVWGKNDLALICGCGNALVDKSGQPKDGLVEKVCRVLMEKCGICHQTEGKRE